MSSAEASRSDSDRRLAAWATALLIPMGFLAFAGLLVLLVDMPHWAEVLVVGTALVVGLALGFRAANRITGTPWRATFLQAVVLFLVLGAGSSTSAWVSKSLRGYGPWLILVVWGVVLAWPSRDRTGIRRSQRRR